MYNPKNDEYCNANSTFHFKAFLVLLLAYLIFRGFRQTVIGENEPSDREQGSYHGVKNKVCPVK
jgi:hypothetical protein